MNVLVTGATGFTGGHLARTLAARGYRVRALVRDTERARDLAAHGIELAVGDLRDTASIEAVLSDHGRTIDDLSVAVADLFNANDRSGSIVAIRLRGVDATRFGIPLLLALNGASDLPIGQTPESIGGKDVLRLAVPGRELDVPLYLWAEGDVAWFVEAETCVIYTPERGCETSEVDRPLLEEILGKLP